MLVLIAVLLALVPATAILYPFLRRLRRDELLVDESSTQSYLMRRWDAALAGLKNTELEWAIGNLSEDDYIWLRRQYVTEAAIVMKTMELEEEEEEELLTTIKREVRQARLRAVGSDSDDSAVRCLHCSSGLKQGERECRSCGKPVTATRPEAVPGSNPSGEVVGE